MRRLCQEALADGFSHFKLKVGRSLEDDLRRTRIAREVIGPDRQLMVDANQVWSVPEAIEWMRALAEVDPMWIEEPTSPDDILGHAAIARAIAPIKVATGEHVHNRVMWKQLFQANAISYAQIDACRLASVNEVLAVQLLAARFGVPSAPMRAGSACASWSSTWRPSTSSCVSGTWTVAWWNGSTTSTSISWSLPGCPGRYVMPRPPGYTELLPARWSGFGSPMDRSGSRMRRPRSTPATRGEHAA